MYLSVSLDPVPDMAVERPLGDGREHAHAGGHDGGQSGDEKGVVLQPVPSDVRAPDLVLAATADLRETVRAAGPVTVHPETEHHLRETVSAPRDRAARRQGSPGNRETDRPAESGLPDLPETYDIVRAHLPEAYLLRAHVPEAHVPGAQGLPEEIRIAGDHPSDHPETARLLSDPVSRAEGGPSACAPDQLRQARPTDRPFPACLPIGRKTLLPLRIRGYLSKDECSNEIG